MKCYGQRRSMVGWKSSSSKNSTMFRTQRWTLLFAVVFAGVVHLAGAGPPPVPVTGDFRILSGLISLPPPGREARAFAGTPLVFAAVDQQGDLRFEWTVSDGTLLEGPQVTYAFSKPGDATLSLTVTQLVFPNQVAQHTMSLRILPNFSGGDPLVTFGGNLGNWGTELLLSNGSPEGLVVKFHPAPLIVTGCPATCPEEFQLLVPAFGTTKVSASAPGQNVSEGLSADYVTVPAGTTPPSLRVRAINTLFPNMTNPIPVVRLSSLIVLDSSALSFPGATRDGSGRSSLVLAGLLLPDLSVGSSVSGVIEARDSAGNLLGAAPFAVESGDTLFLPDIVALLGISALDDGQIRVVRTSSDGYVWGMMVTSYGDGSIATSVGGSP